MVWAAVRVVVAILALATLGLTPLWMEDSSGGRELVAIGVIIDLVAIAVLVAVAWSWWRSRRRAGA